MVFSAVHMHLKNTFHRCGERFLKKKKIIVEDAEVVSQQMCCENPKRLNRIVKQIILIPMNHQSFSHVLSMRLG